jgi:glucose/arabinose dehydrogenase
VWSAVLGGAVAVLLATQIVDTRACGSEPTPVPAPTPSPSPAPSTAPVEVFTTVDGVRFQVETVATGLEIPWSMAFMPDGRLFVTERPGRVRILDLAARTSTLALTLDDVFAQGEAGLLGVALDPDFSQNRLVYLHYAARASGSGSVSRVVRYREAGGTLGERAVLLDNIPAATIHDGGRLRFGPDRLLYVTAGDANNTALPQDLASTAGKILRLNANGTTAPGNPFGSPVYSYGHRNPQGLDWHPATGDLWASEHGASGNDEINVIDSGANYGWPRIEGAQSMPGMRTPIVFFNPAIAPSGASFYRGQRFPRFVNNLFVGALRGTHVLRLTLDGSSRRVSAQERLLEGRFGRIRDVVSGPDGYLYFCTSNRDGRGSPTSGDDRIARLVPVS